MDKKLMENNYRTIIASQNTSKYPLAKLQKANWEITINSYVQ